MLSNKLLGLAALPVRVKAPLVLAALVVLGPPSPLVTILAVLVSMVAGPEEKRHA